MILVLINPDKLSSTLHLYICIQIGLASPGFPPKTLFAFLISTRTKKLKVYVLRTVALSLLMKRAAGAIAWNAALTACLVVVVCLYYVAENTE
jgi:hypothetical protein